jgi:hypothetical protein
MTRHFRSLVRPTTLLATIALAGAALLPAAARAQDTRDTPITPKQVAKNTANESKRVYKRSEKAVRKAGKQTRKQARRTARHVERTVSPEERERQARQDSLHRHP